MNAFFYWDAFSTSHIIQKHQSFSMETVMYGNPSKIRGNYLRNLQNRTKTFDLIFANCSIIHENLSIFWRIFCKDLRASVS